MNFYIAHIKDTDFKSIDLYSSLNKKESKTKLNSIEDLYKINDAEFLLILIPASEVSSYEFTQNKLLSKEINIANFISEVDSNFIDPVSENEYFLSKNETINIPLGSKHRAQNLSNNDVHFIEVQTGKYFGEDDIVRIDDDYNRK